MKKLLLIAFASLALIPVTQAQTPSYTYVDLGVPASLANDSTAFSYATGINDAGTVVGAFGEQAGYPGSAFAYSNGAMTDLSKAITGTAGGECYAYGINASGDIVGSIKSFDFGEIPEAFLLPANGSVTLLGAFNPSGESTAYGINSTDQIAGISTDTNGFTTAFVYTGGTLHDLGFLQSGSDAESEALNLNDSGVAVGNSTTYVPVLGSDDPVGMYTTSYTTNTGLTGIGPETFPIGKGETDTTKDIAYDIDSTGTIVGGAVPICPGEAFSYKNGVFTYLGILPDDDSSYATAKNDAGQIVGASFIWEYSSGSSITGGTGGSDGTSYFPGGPLWGTDRRAFVYENGQMYDLNAVSNVPAGWTLVQANAINNSGQIVGYAVQGTTVTEPQSVTHAFLLTPKDVFSGSPLGGGWYYSAWFGIYNSTYYPWINDADLGFIYVDTSDNTNLYLYVLNGASGSLGWLYTTQSLFPNVYSFSRGAWLYYGGGTSFYNYSTAAWEFY